MFSTRLPGENRISGILWDECTSLKNYNVTTSVLVKNINSRLVIPFFDIFLIFQYYHDKQKTASDNFQKMGSLVFSSESLRIFSCKYVSTDFTFNTSCSINLGNKCYKDCPISDRLTQ